MPPLILPTPQSTRDLIAAYFGVAIPLRPQEQNLTVGTTAIRIGKYAAQRVAISFVNSGTATIAIGFNPALTVAQGFQLGAGQFLSFNWFLDGELVMQQFYAISGTAGQTLYVVDSVLEGNS